jgi:acetyl esterase/lipase
MLQRDADLRLRSTAGPMRTRVWWPAARDPAVMPGLLVFFADPARPDCHKRLGDLSTRADVVVISVPCAPTSAAIRAARPDDAAIAVEWAADHGAELEADPQRLFIGGSGTGAALAAAAALQAREREWPPISRQLLIDLDLAHCELGVHPPADLAPVTMVTFAANADARRYAACLRSASVPVEELHYAQADHDAVVADLADALVRDQISPSKRRLM